MSFTPEQVSLLTAPLSRSHVKSRKQAGRDLSYIEGWHAISEANRIFGFDAWDRETVELRQLGDPREVDGKWRIAYMAKVRIVVHTRVDADGAWAVVIREGTGYGSGIDRDIGSSHESAIKEAETDAMKRALMTFGNPFGLALYDKEQHGVEDQAPAPKQPDTKPATGERAQKAWAWAQEQSDIIRKMGDSKRFAQWHDDNAAAIATLKGVAPDAHARLLEEIDATLARFNPLAA